MLDRARRKAHGPGRQTGADESSSCLAFLIWRLQSSSKLGSCGAAIPTLNEGRWRGFQSTRGPLSCLDRTELLREALMTATQSAARHGFELVREQSLAEINSTARYYRHAKTGAELLSLVNTDENKVF